MDATHTKAALELNSFQHRYSSTPVVKLAADALAKAAPVEILRDELYCQALKQLIGNGSHDTFLYAWEWMTMLSLAFTPANPALTEVIKSFADNQGSEDPDPKVAALARHCSRQLSRRAESGSRVCIPSLSELEGVQQGVFLYPIKVHVLLKTTMIMVDSCSTVNEIMGKIGLDNLKLPFMKNLGLLHLQEHSLGMPLHYTDKIVDVLAQKETETASSEIKSPRQAQTELVFGALAWNFRLTPDMDDNLLNALYEVLRRLVINSDIACSLAEVLDLSILITRATPSLAVVKKEKLNEYVPQHIITNHPDQLVQQIVDASAPLAAAGFGERDAKMAFVRVGNFKNIWTWSFFPLVCGAIISNSNFSLRDSTGKSRGP
jgi:hypothetical protein